LPSLEFSRSFAGTYALRQEGRDRAAAAQCLRERLLEQGEPVVLSSPNWTVELRAADAAGWEQREGRYLIHTTRALAEELIAHWSAPAAEPKMLEQLPDLLAG